MSPTGTARAPRVRLDALVVARGLASSRAEAARLILAGAARGAATVYVPARWRPIMAILRAIPSRIFRRLDV